MDFLTQSIRLFTFSRIDVRVHVIYLIWMAFRLFDGRADLSFNLCWLSMLFAIILCHEFGHCFGARSVGGDADQILMWPLGGLAFARAPQTPWAQFVTVACGPLVNVGFCVLSALLLIVATGRMDVVSLNPFTAIPYEAAVAIAGQPWLWYVSVFFWINLYLLYFNLLPIYPLDGGQLLWTILWPIIGMHRALTISAQIGVVGAVALGVWGLTQQPPSFILIGIAVFGGISSYQALQAARYGLREEHFRSYQHAGRYPRAESWFSRLIKRLRGGPRPSRPADNPNPGGWEARQEREQQAEEQIDAILKKVHEHGLRSLSYIERQKLERATRERQSRERDLDRQD
jgi:Zn-dependent protease